MSNPTLSEVDERKILSEINHSPRLQSFLYDCNLLPEQLKKESDKWSYMILIVCAFRLGQIHHDE